MPIIDIPINSCKLGVLWYNSFVENELKSDVQRIGFQFIFHVDIIPQIDTKFKY